jgi:hypothetical protein
VLTRKLRCAARGLRPYFPGNVPIRTSPGNDGNPSLARGLFDRTLAGEMVQGVQLGGQPVLGGGC